jgi:phosphopantothenoylcysteine decarboxylase/phosphopantothenate--cysteine ligase
MGKRVLLGVTGGIAAYKSPDLVRRLRERDFEVRVVMTAGAEQFLSPLSLQAVSGYAVRRSLFDLQAEAAMSHIELARWADMIVVAPASADFMAKLAAGLGDDLLSTLCLASEAPVVLAPAMNRQMWAHPATQTNRRTLLARGVRMLGPAEGSQACGEIGPGRMLEPADIAVRIDALHRPGAMAQLSVLVTAGPTQEAIDPVRFVSNHSSGKMGYAVAQAAEEAGANVTLISGPTALEPPPRVHTVQVVSAEEMHEGVMACATAHDIFIGAAAVADYRPAEPRQSKMKKEAAEISIPMRRTADILADVAALPARPFVVGFAAETEDLERHAREKLERKSLDLIAANRVGIPGSGFGSDDNALHVFWREGSMQLGLASKVEVARALIQLIADRYHAKNQAQDPGR